MSWEHREYADEGEYGQAAGRRVYRGPGMNKLSVTTAIIIANAIVAVLMFSRSSLGDMLTGFGVMQADAVMHGQVWRLFTATYMHAGMGHILFNMLALYFLGPALERTWGRRQFFLVYTLGGIAGNILLTLAGLVNFIDPQTFGLGASGSVLTLLGAAAVLFPDARVYVYFLFPVRIRTCVIVYGIWYVYNIFMQGSNYGGDMCHVAGLVFGIAWAYSGGLSLSGKHRTSIDPGSVAGRIASGLHVSRGPGRGPGAWEKRMKQRREDEETIDRILAKVTEHGMQSLSMKERKALAQATQRRRAEEDYIDELHRD